MPIFAPVEGPPELLGGGDGEGGGGGGVGFSEEAGVEELPEKSAGMPFGPIVVILAGVSSKFACAREI